MTSTPKIIESSEILKFLQSFALMANINERICKWNFIIPNEKIMRCLWNGLKGAGKKAAKLQDIYVV